MTDLEINQACAKMMKKCWHEYKKPLTFRDGPILCIKEGCGETISHLIGFHGRIRQFDYLNNKSDAYDLIQFVVNEWEGWNDFLWWRLKDTIDTNEWPCEAVQLGFEDLLKDQRALPTAVAEWVKEKG